MQSNRILAAALLTLSFALTGCGDDDTPVLVGPIGPAGPAGVPGPAGPAGANGQLRIYGDGSAGVGTATTSVLGETSFTNRNFQFTDFTVPAGVTLTVPSGTVIRCTGTFRNLGIINVRTFSASDSPPFGTDGDNSVSVSFLGAGAGNPAISLGGVAGPSALGGRGGINGSVPQLPYTVRSPIGGGGGTDYDSEGGEGGGTFTVLAQTAAINDVTGIINAVGESADTGGGGGGGGVVTLASQTRVDNLVGGQIAVNGGNGGTADTDEAGGGGGGGGLIQFLAPTVNIPGTETVAGGLAGAGGAAGAVTGNPRYGGGGGGASFGNGGSGGTVDTATDTGAAGAAGEAGFVFTSAAGADPTALLRVIQ